MSTKNEYIEKLAAQLKEWSAQIDLLAAKAENAQASAKLEYAQEVDELRAKQQEASGKLEELENANNEAWESIKETADKVWYDLKAGVDTVASKFK
jgi:chromosome segregation ATPase